MPTPEEQIAALEARAQDLEDRLANCRLEAASALVTARENAAAGIRSASAAALQEAANEILQRLDAAAARGRSTDWQQGIRDAADILRARAAIETTAVGGPPRRWHPPHPRQHP